MEQQQQKNPPVQFQVNFKEIANGFKLWLSKQSLAVEAAVVSAAASIPGALVGATMGTLTPGILSPDAALNPQAMASFKQVQALSGDPFVQACNFAVMTGVNAGISCVMKRIRGKEDVQSSMAAAFGSGAMYSLVSGMGGPNQAVNAVTSGLFFALVQGGIFQLGQKFSQPQVADTFYDRTRMLLPSLDLQNYEKNSSALKGDIISLGRRLIILDHEFVFAYKYNSGTRN